MGTVEGDLCGQPLSLSAPPVGQKRKRYLGQNEDLSSLTQGWGWFLSPSHFLAIFLLFSLFHF